MRIAIIGSGALGSLFAAYLSSLEDVVMIGHWPEQLERLQNSGLVLIHPDGRRTRHNFPVSQNPADFYPIELALVLVKAYQTDKAAVNTSLLLAENGVAVTLQNGLGNNSRLSSVLGSNRVSQGVTSLGGNMVAPGIVQHAGHGHTFVSKSSDGHQILNKLVNVLNQVGLPTTFADNLNSLIWGKLAVNAGINPLTAMLNVPNGELLGSVLLTKLMAGAVLETAAVAQAKGIPLPFNDPVAQTMEVARATAKNFSSMLQDRLRGSQTEIAYISGAIIQEGEKLGISTPINKEYFRILSVEDLGQAISQSPILSIRQLNDYTGKESR